MDKIRYTHVEWKDFGLEKKNCMLCKNKDKGNCNIWLNKDIKEGYIMFCSEYKGGKK